MYQSTYLPVNATRSTSTVYSMNSCYPKAYLLRAKNFLESGQSDPSVYFSNGYVSFLDEPTYHWTVCEVFLAYKALEIAEASNFSFYMIKDLSQNPQLFVSSKFNGRRIIVNALTMQTVILPNEAAKQIVCMIDRCYDIVYCQELFNVARITAAKYRTCLTGLIVFAGTDDEYLVLNHYATPYGNVIESLGADTIDSLFEILDGADETEAFTLCVDDGAYHHNDLAYYPILSKSTVEFYVKLYQACQSKKSNYVPIYNENAEDALYYSTNQRYLVHAKTLECVVIENQRIKAVLLDMVKQPICSNDLIASIWHAACEVA